MNGIVRLLDNGWNVQLHRQVDGKYCAAGKRRFSESYSDIFGKMNNLPLTPDGSLDFAAFKGPPMPHRIAVADTVEAALEQLADQILGLQSTP